MLTPSSSSPSSVAIFFRARSLRIEAGYHHRRNDPFFQGCLSCGLRIFQQGLAFFHFGFGRGTAVDLCHAPGKFRQSLLKFFAVVFAVGRTQISLRIWSARPAISSFLPAAADDRGFLGRDLDFASLSEVAELERFPGRCPSP